MTLQDQFKMRPHENDSALDRAYIDGFNNALKLADGLGEAVKPDGMSPEEIEVWRHHENAADIAAAVQRYVAMGEELHDLQLIETIQAILKEKFPNLGEPKPCPFRDAGRKWGAA